MRRHGWTSAWIGRGVGVAAAVGLLAGEAWAQAPVEDSYPQFKWIAREQLHNHANAQDEAEDIVYWKDTLPERHCILPR